MIKTCIVCTNSFEIITRNTKYCPKCKIIKHQDQIKEWKKTNITKKDCDKYCLECFETFPINTNKNKLYCDKCLKKHRKSDHKQYHIKKTMHKKLKIFYKNLLINFIQNPYLNDTHKKLCIIK